MKAWKTEHTTIYQADFRVTLTKVARRGGCDLVFMSPPYDDARTYGNDVSWRFEDYQALGDHVHEALKPGGQCLMVLDGPVREWRKGKGTERSFTPWRVMLDWAERVGFRVPDRLAYGRLGLPGRYEGRFRNDWEPLLWFQRDGAQGFFDKDILSKRARYQMGGISTGRRADNSQVIRNQSGEAVRKGLTRPGTFWNYGSIANDIQASPVEHHPAPFALPLAEDVVRCFAPEGGLVCDPFVGSGTSAVAAVRRHRAFVGGDAFANDEGKPWAKVAHERAKSVTHMKGLFYEQPFGS